MHDSTKATLVRLLLFISVSVSIGLMYHTNMVRKDFEIFTNPDGPLLGE
jgi:hypothetical protein